MKFRKRWREEQEESAYTTSAILGKDRSPVGVVFMSFITLGIYFVYWHYKVNKEMAAYDIRIEVSPDVSAIAVSLGWLILFIPSFVSVYNTVARAQIMFEYNEPTIAISPGYASFLHALILLGFPMLSLFYPAYLQGKLNRFWRLEAAKATNVLEEERRAG
ncbi:MAG: DUF4234 domain-containing protein [Chloroflexi bacterium]|nr:DUF4234 domain-containing protein [Chloroflexota bacterium]